MSWNFKAERTCETAFTAPGNFHRYSNWVLEYPLGCWQTCIHSLWTCIHRLEIHALDIFIETTANLRTEDVIQTAVLHINVLLSIKWSSVLNDLTSSIYIHIYIYTCWFLLYLDFHQCQPERKYRLRTLKSFPVLARLAFSSVLPLWLEHHKISSSVLELSWSGCFCWHLMPALFLHHAWSASQSATDRHNLCWYIH